MVDKRAGWQDVVVEDVVIRVSTWEPIAIIQHPVHSDWVITWADLRVGFIHPHTRITAAPTGAWVLYTPETADETQENEATASRVSSTALHISPTGEITRFMDLVNVHAIGVTRHGLWLTSGQWDMSVDDHAAWVRVRELLVLEADGRTRYTSIDRMPSMAFEDASLPRLVVYAGAPDALHDDHGGTGYTYRYLQVEVPTGHLPAVLRVDELSSMPIEAEDVPGWSEDDAPPIHPLVPGDPRVSWDRVDLPGRQKKAAVEAACAEFGNLGAYWRTPAGEMLPLTEAVADARVDVIEQWPQTRVEVSFTHPHYRHGRLRRTYRVFDDAGRIQSVRYASIHLMEDIDTRALPPARDARDGILDI